MRFVKLVLVGLSTMMPLAVEGQDLMPSGGSLRLGIGPEFPDEVAYSYCDGTRAVSVGAAAVWRVGRLLSADAGIARFGRIGDAEGCVAFAPCLPDQACLFREQYGPGITTAYLSAGPEFDLGGGLRPLFRLGAGTLLGEGEEFLEWKLGVRIGDRPGRSIVVAIAQMRFDAIQLFRTGRGRDVLETRGTRVTMTRLEVAYEGHRF